MALPPGQDGLPSILSSYSMTLNCILAPIAIIYCLILYPLGVIPTVDGIIYAGVVWKIPLVAIVLLGNIFVLTRTRPLLVALLLLHILGLVVGAMETIVQFRTFYNCVAGINAAGAHCGVGDTTLLVVLLIASVVYAFGLILSAMSIVHYWRATNAFAQYTQFEKSRRRYEDIQMDQNAA